MTFLKPFFKKKKKEKKTVNKVIIHNKTQHKIQFLRQMT